MRTKDSLGAIYIQTNQGGTLVYMHLSNISLNVDKNVEVGTRIGSSGNKGTGPYHLHIEWLRDQSNTPFEVSYSNTGTTLKWEEDIVGGTLLSATQEVDIPDLTYNPETLQSEIGSYENGWHDDGTSQVFLDNYLRQKGAQLLGRPFDHGGTKWVHDYSFWYNNDKLITVLLQDYYHDEHGQKTIVYTPGEDKAYLLEGCLGYLWWDYQDSLGVPTSDEIDDSSLFPDREQNDGC